MSAITGKILIVDDVKTNIAYLNDLLEKKGHEIHSCQIADMAIQYIKQKEFDLILLDIEMPETDGFKVCEFIRRSKLNSNTPVIFLTSKNDRQSILHGFDIGAQDYITRPFQDKELLVRVNTHIELKLHCAELETRNKDLQKLVDIRTNRLNAALKQLKVSYKQLNHSKKELESLENAKESFLRMINHEIRTPLNGILGFHELLKETSPDGKIAEYLNMMHESVKRLERFSMQALFITELKTGKYTCEKTEIDIASAVGQCICELKATLEEKNQVVQCKIENAVLFHDLKLFRHAIFSLLENAIRLSQRGGIIEIKGIVKTDFAYQMSINCSGKCFSASVLKNANRLFSDENFIDENTGMVIYTIGLILKEMQGNLLIENNTTDGTNVKMIFRLIPEYNFYASHGISGLKILKSQEKIHGSC